MAMCKFCGKPFQWGRADDGWVPLEPIESHDGMDRTHQDSDGVLRADHRKACTQRGGPPISVVKLARAVPAAHVLGGYGWTPPDPETGETSPIVPSNAQ
jgi:hypothetical protein